MATIPTLEPALDGAAEPARDPHPAEARGRGGARRLDRSVIAETVRVGTIGDIGANLAKFDAGDRQVPIRVQLPESVRGDRQLLELLKVPAKNGAAVPLSAVADVELGAGADLDRPV